MANIKSAKKRIKVTEVKTLKNRMIKSALKTEEAKALYTSVVKSLDMATSKGVVHKNMAARKKSRLAAKLNAMA